VHTTLTIRVTGLDFDSKASALQVKGKTIGTNVYVPQGSFHTLDLELNRKFSLSKADGWDSVAREMLQEAINDTSRANLWAVVMQPGVANIYYVTEYRTVFQQTVSEVMPGKNSLFGGYDKAIDKFHTTLLASLLRLLGLANLNDKSDPKPLLLASPGFAAQNFFNHMKSYATNMSHRALTALLTKTVVTHSSSASEAALTEVLASKAVSAQVSEARFAREARLVDKLFDALKADEGRAWYGPREVTACVDKAAVGRGGGALLISQRLFRSEDVSERKRWVALVDKVKRDGGEVRVLSEVHESGRRLEMLSGVAAILTFPLYDIDDDEESGD
jgi:protein pelota